MGTPVISIVLPVYNAGPYLIDSLASMVEQSYQEWELICINDGSTDSSPDVLNWFATQDPRIRVLHQSNRGLVDALNRGWQEAKAPLIARMDHDDISLPHRLAKQLDYLRNAPDCVALGGAILEIDSDSSPLGVERLPSMHAEICDNLLHRHTGLYHPTVIIRTEALRAVGGYREEHQWVEDHDLWLRLGLRGKLANIPDVVLCYRQHASSICWQRSQARRIRMNEVLKEAYQARGLALPSELLADTQILRSPAGPGKWARVAAKGGHPLVAFKHLRQLWKDSGWRIYSLRMSIEVLMRSALGLGRRLVTHSPHRIPDFGSWHNRFNAQFGAQVT